MLVDSPNCISTVAIPVISVLGEEMVAWLSFDVCKTALRFEILTPRTSLSPSRVTRVPPAEGPQLGLIRTVRYESESRRRMKPLDVKSCWLLLTSIEKLPPSLGLM